MKYLIITVILSFILNDLTAQTKFSVVDAIKFRNKYIMVCDTVYKTKILNENTRVLYLGSSKLKKSLQIIQTSNKKIKSAHTLVGEIICVGGIVRFKNEHYILYTSKKLLVLGPIDL